MQRRVIMFANTGIELSQFKWYFALTFILDIMNYLSYHNIMQCKKVYQFKFYNCMQEFCHVIQQLYHWIIVCCLTDNGKSCMHFQEANKFNNILNKLLRKAPAETTTFDCHRKRVKSWVWKNKLAFRSSYSAPSFFEIYRYNSARIWNIN